MTEPISATTYFLLGILLLLCIFIFRFFQNRFKYWKNKNVSYLEPIIPFGNSLDLYLGKCSFGELFSNVYLELRKKGAKHGGLYYFWKPFYIPTDPEVIKRIIISDANNFPNHALYISPKDDPLSGHLFNMEDHKWRTLRSKTPSAFTSAKMKKMFLIMEQMTGQYRKILEPFADAGRPVEIKSEITRFTTDIIAACTFGMESNTMKNENEELLKHGRNFFDYQWSLYKNTMVVLVPRKILQILKFRINLHETENYMKNMFNNIKNFRKAENSARGDLIDTLIRLTERREEEKDFTGKNVMEPLDLNEFTAQMFLFFSAGFETSSSTQTFALYELARNPQCQTKLREEIETVLKRHENKLTYDAIMDMKYLDQVVDETLRIYPIFPILVRQCKEDYKIPGSDVTIDKGCAVMVTNMGIQRDPEYYPDPLQFDPERFTAENKSKRPFIAHMPFGEGPRICVGKRFGLLQSKVGLVTVIRDFEVSLNEKTTKQFKFVSKELILRKKGDVWLNLKRL